MRWSRQGLVSPACSRDSDRSDNSLFGTSLVYSRQDAGWPRPPQSSWSRAAGMMAVRGEDVGSVMCDLVPLGSFTHNSTVVERERDRGSVQSVT